MSLPSSEILLEAAELLRAAYLDDDARLNLNYRADIDASKGERRHAQAQPDRTLSGSGRLTRRLSICDTRRRVP